MIAGGLRTDCFPREDEQQRAPNTEVRIAGPGVNMHEYLDATADVNMHGYLVSVHIAAVVAIVNVSLDKELVAVMMEVVGMVHFVGLHAVGVYVVGLHAVGLHAVGVHVGLLAVGVYIGLVAVVSVGTVKAA